MNDDLVWIFSIFVVALSLIGFVNADAYSMSHIKATDSDGNIIRETFLNQTIYFHMDLGRHHNEDPNVIMISEIFSLNLDNTVQKQIREIELPPDGTISATWEFTPQNIGNYWTHVWVEEMRGPVPVGDMYSFLVTDSQKQYKRKTIEMFDQFYDEKCPRLCVYPPFLTVNKGTIVEWKNLGNGSYTVTTGVYHELGGGHSFRADGRILSEEFGQGEYFPFLFLEPGKYEYFDSAHRQLNKGGVVYVTIIPDWFKNNALWWGSEKISDSDFVLGTQFLIQKGIIPIVEETKTKSTNDKMPSWVKETAFLWAQDKIKEENFLNSIQYLVEYGLLKV